MVYYNHHYIARIKPASHRNYPPDIQELIKSLTEAREAVKDLTARLKSAQNECHRLEAGWHKYSLTLSPIRACPNEILSMIFWFYLSENQHWVRRLQLVCRQWRDIVINDPRLWNRIYIKVPDLEWDLKSISHSAKKHTQMCLRRSGASLLDVKLDCDELRSTYDQIMNKIKEPFTGMFTWDPNVDAEVALENWMSGLDVEALDIPAITGKCRPEHILSATRILAGKQGENMGRFGSLELTLPRFDEEKLALRLWRRFDGPAPSLNRLVITTSGFDSESTDEELAGSFPCLSGLKYIDVDNVRIFKNLKLEPSSIESLVIREGVQFWAGYDLSRFSCLQRLELFDYFDSDAPNETITVSLPLLRQLTLNGNVQHINQVQFHTPILQDFNILGRSESDLRRNPNFLPDVESIHVRWQRYIGSYSGEDWIQENLLKEMKIVTGHFDKAKQLTVSDFARTALIETVQLLHQGGELSSALEMIGFENKRGIVETIEVRTLLLPNSS